MDKVVEPNWQLAGLLKLAFDKKGWKSAKVAAAEAKKLGIKGLSARNIDEYRRAKRKRIKDFQIRQLARLCGESEHEWVERCSELTGVPSLLLNRESIVSDQERLEYGDKVTLVSSRPFLEPNDAELAGTVLRNLNKGVIYTYYFPGGESNPHGTDASRSYAEFRKVRVARHSFENSPSLFGYSVDPSQFRFFSSLHTIVRFDCPGTPSLNKAYAFIEIGPTVATRPEQAWYPLPDSVWTEVDGELQRARSAVADENLPILGLNPHLRGVRAEYANWFQKPQSVEQYGELRPILGHAGDECLKALKTQMGRFERKRNPCRFLDIGCGDGTLTHGIASYLQTQGEVTVTGLDISRPQLNAAESVFQPGPTFIAVNEAFEEFTTNENFEIITAIHSFYTIDEAYLRRVHQLLAPGGTAFFWLASRQENVFTSLCDTLDAVLRPGQRRNAAEDIVTYAQRAGLAPSSASLVRRVSGLLGQKGDPTPQGRKVIDFCALRSMSEKDNGWGEAVANLRKPESTSEEHSLSDVLIVVRRRD